MAVIHQSLNEQVKSNPQASYPVLITLKGTALPPELANKGKFIFTNKIFAARLSGQEIQSYAHNDQIDAIEPDAEVGTM